MSEKMTINVPTLFKPNQVFHENQLVHLDEWNKAIHTERVQKLLDVGICLCINGLSDSTFKYGQIRPDLVLGTIHDLETVKDGFLVVNTCGDAAQVISTQVKMGYKAGIVAYTMPQKIKAMNSCGYINSYNDIHLIGFEMIPPEEGDTLIQTKEFDKMKHQNHNSCLLVENDDIPKDTTSFFQIM